MLEQKFKDKINRLLNEGAHIESFGNSYKIGLLYITTEYVDLCGTCGKIVFDTRMVTSLDLLDSFNKVQAAYLIQQENFIENYLNS